MAFESRDEKREPKGLLFARATRALANCIENLGPFVAADLALIVTHHPGGLGASIWVAARIIYLPLYLSGISFLRTLCWLVSLAGLGMMLAQVGFR